MLQEARLGGMPESAAGRNDASLPVIRNHLLHRLLTRQLLDVVLRLSNATWLNPVRCQEGCACRRQA